MKILQRLLLINWHFIVHETIELKRLNFLTGKTGSGKSTIIDALQVLVLGDTAGLYFNKAANEQSRRSLRGYLQGEVAENEAEGVVYLRQGKNFSSYIVGEFWDTKEKKGFCLGVVFESYADGGKEEHRFFYLNGELPEHHFIMNKTPLDIRSLREWAVTNEGRNNFRYFDSNATYRENFRHLMGGLGEKFFSLFRKAVPFSPIMDIKDFIANFVCNVSGKVEIEDMRENIRHYKQLEGEMEQVTRRIGSLRGIAAKFAQYDDENTRLLMHRFLVTRAELAEADVQLTSAGERHRAWQRDLAVMEQQLHSLEEQRVTLDRRYQEAVNEKARCEAQRQKVFLEEKLRQFREKLEVLRANQSRLHSLLRQYAAACEKLREMADGMGAYGERLRADAADSLDEDFWRGFQREFQQALTQAREESFRLKTLLEQGRKRLEEMKADIARLRQGVKSYDKNLLDLAAAIEAELSGAGRAVRPRIFADVLEIREPRWRNAVEGYLHTQKFNLLIEPQYFVQALQVYDRLKFERNFYDIGLVDVGKLKERVRPPRPGSLAEEIVTDDPNARVYADYLLGGVMKVERAADLRNYPTAITPTCMLYRGFVARQLHPDRYAVPYIGKKAVEEQIRIKEGALQREQQECTFLSSRFATFEILAGFEALRDDDRERVGRYIAERSELPALEQQIRQLTEELGRLDLTKVYELDETIRELEKQKESLTRRIRDLDGQYAVLGSNIQMLGQERIPALQQNLLALQGRLRETFSEEWRNQVGEMRFLGELSRLGNPEKVRGNFLSQLSRTESQREEKWKELMRLRSDFNRDFRAALEVTATLNTTWSCELNRLEQTCLPEYAEKIRSAKDKAQKEFQEDFISKLRQNIEQVKTQIDELNTALKDVPFGRSKYRFRVAANTAYKEYYDMIMDEMLMEGFTLFSNEFQNRYQPVVEQLFHRIVATAGAELSSEQREEMERNLLKFTDYRTYLDFDLMDIDEEGRESRLSKTISKKSGGETQTPFYIAVLASFLQTYRVNQQNHNNTLRLIVFDEAFSKMDHQRIQESIRLLADIGLQVIIAAPTDNIADIAPLVERNLCVTRIRQQTVVKAFDPREME